MCSHSKGSFSLRVFECFRLISGAQGSGVYDEDLGVWMFLCSFCPTPALTSVARREPSKSGARSSRLCILQCSKRPRNNKCCNLYRSETSPDPCVIVDTFGMLSVKRRFATPDDARHSPTFADACERLTNINATISRRLLDPWTPTLKREPFCGAFGKK